MPLADALGRRAVLHQAADGRQEVAERILGIDAAFDGPAVDLHVRLLERQLLAGRGADHQLDEIDAGDQLGDRMLDLQAGVHLQEEEAAVLAGDELDGAGAVVADGLGEGDRLLAHGPARLLIEQRRGRLLDDLLVAALDRALALVEVDDVAVLVADELDLDVARIDDELLDEHAVVAEATPWPRTRATGSLPRPPLR